MKIPSWAKIKCKLLYRIFCPTELALSTSVICCDPFCKDHLQQMEIYVKQNQRLIGYIIKQYCTYTTKELTP